VEPPGEAKTDAWIWKELANRLGFGEEFDYTREEFLELGFSKLKKHDINLEVLRTERHAELPVDYIPWSDYKFRTPSGKYEFTSVSAEKAGFGGQISLSLPNETKWNNPVLAEKYPYTLLTIHPLRSNHSQHYHLFAKEPEVKVEVSSDIATAKDLEDGELVRVWNGRGEIQGRAAILKMAHPGTINIDEGIWRKFGGPVNMLTSDAESDNRQGSTLYDCLVNIEKV
jgi:anaerobic selenocysteine-containing dehydrogenase